LKKKNKPNTKTILGGLQNLWDEKKRLLEPAATRANNLDPKKGIQSSNLWKAT
jgi:hypothetical protein